MKLPFFTKNGSDGKIYFGIFLKEKEGIGLLIKLRNSNIVLLDQEKFHYSNGWENITEDLDEVILKLEQRSNTKVHETIFFVYSHYIEEKTKEIRKPYLQKIKDLVSKLSLKALGYIECYEAVTHYLEKKEELPLTAVLLELDHSNLSVFVFKRGELVHEKVLAHTENIIDDLLTCFSEIKGKFLLPSRIVLYNSKDLDDESTDIVTYRWSEELFVQLPRVQIVKEHELIQGLLGIFGEQFAKKALSTRLGEEKPQEAVLGFVIGGDVREIKASTPQKKPDLSPPRSSPLPDTILQLASPLYDSITKVVDGLSSLPKFFNKKWTAIFGAILIVISLLLNEYFLHKAVLTVYLPSQTLKKDITLTSDDLKVETVSKSVSLKESKTTSGKKDIGERAHGSITVHNFADVEKTFSKGTGLEAGGLKFSLDQDVKIASASFMTISGGLVKQPGKAKANVSAIEIGPQGNLGSGKQFTIGDSPVSLYFGINDSALTGGTRKEIKTVSSKDIEDLKKSIQEQVKKQKLDQLDPTKNIDKKSLSGLTETTSKEEIFDHEVGEEADKVTLQSKVQITLYLYKDSEAKNLIGQELAKELKEGFTLEKFRLSYIVKDAEKEDSKISIKISADGKAVEAVAKSEIVNKVKGRSYGATEDLLKDSLKVEAFELDIKPKLPLIKNWMPFFEKNINLKISSL